MLSRHSIGLGSLRIFMAFCILSFFLPERLQTSPASNFVFIRSKAGNLAILWLR